MHRINVGSQLLTLAKKIDTNKIEHFSYFGNIFFYDPLDNLYYITIYYVPNK